MAHLLKQQRLWNKKCVIAFKGVEVNIISISFICFVSCIGSLVFVILIASLCASTDFTYKRHVPLRNVDLLSEALNIV